MYVYGSFLAIYTQVKCLFMFADYYRVYQLFMSVLKLVLLFLVSEMVSTLRRGGNSKTPLLVWSFSMLCDLLLLSLLNTHNKAEDL